MRRPLTDSLDRAERSLKQVVDKRAYLPRAIWAEPRWVQFLEWCATPGLAQATWEWPERKFLYSSTVVEPGQVFLIPRQKPHMVRQFYGN